MIGLDTNVLVRLLVDDDPEMDAFTRLLAADDVVVESPQEVARAIDGVVRGADFADALIDAVASRLGCHRVASFDQAAQRILGWSSPADLR